MDFVGDYKTKKLLAEKLRDRQKTLLGSQVDMGPIVTPGQGAAPTQIQANPWGAIANLGMSYLGAKAGQKAEAAEQEAQQARMQALEGLMGQQGAGNAPGQPGALGGGPRKLNVQELMQLSDLGLPDQVLKKIAPDDPSLGAITQAAATPQGIDALVATGVWTKEQGDAAKAAGKQAMIEARDAELDLYKQKKQIDQQYRPPTAGRGPTAFDQKLALYKNDRETYNALFGDKAPGAAGGKGKSKGDPVAENNKMRKQVDEAERLIQDPKNAKMFSQGQRNVGAIIDWKNQNPGNLLPLLANTVAGPMEHPGAAALRRLGTEQAFARVKELYPASNSDIALARSLAANINQSPEAAQAYIDQMRYMMDEYPEAFGEAPVQRKPRGGPGQADGEGVGAGADGGWSIEE